jgi:hypothetical protein
MLAEVMKVNVTSAVAQRSSAAINPWQTRSVFWSPLVRWAIIGQHPRGGGKSQEGRDL